MTIRYIIFVCVVLLAFIVLLTLAITHRPSFPYVLTGKAKTLKVKINAPEILGVRGIEPGHVDLYPFLDNLVSYATKLEFETGANMQRMIEPESPIHLFYLFFNQPTPATVRLVDRAEIQISGGGLYILPNAEKIKYDVEFVFFTPSQQPLWMLSPKDPIEVGKGQIIGFAVKDAIAIEGQINGHFFSRKAWKVPTLNYPLFTGYEAKVSVPATEAWVDVTSKLQVDITESSQKLLPTWSIPISWIKVNKVEGMLQIRDDKKEIGGNLDIEISGKGNDLRIGSLRDKMEIRVEGSTSNLRIDGQQAINNWLRVINDEYPVLVVISTGLIIAVLAGLLTPLAKAMVRWTLPRKH